MKVLFTTTFCLLYSTFLFTQCDVNNFETNVTNATCLSNGSISVQIPGASNCTGWTAILTHYGNQSYLTIPSNGNVTFLGLQQGSYSVALTNGIVTIPSSDNPIYLTSNYQPVSIFPSYIQTTCSSVAPSYTPDGSLGIIIAGGVGPFIYTVSNSLGTTTFGPTTDINHVFNDLGGGEIALISVTDQVGGMMGCLNSVSESYFLTPTPGTQFQINVPGYVFFKGCNPNCNQYTFKAFLSNFHSNQLTKINEPGNATISINGNISNLPLIQPNGESGDIILNAGDSYMINVTDGCFSANFSGIVPLPDNAVTLNPINLYSNCTSSQYIEYYYSRTNWCLNTQTSVSYLDTNTNTYIPLTGSPFNTPAGTTGSISVPSTGIYQLTINDGCQVRTVSTVVNPPIDSNPAEKITKVGNFNTLLENSGSIIVGGYTGHNYNLPQSGVPYPVIVSITPNNGETSVGYIASHPFQYESNYIVNFPINKVISNSASSPAIFTDIPAGIEYKITITDNCGNVAERLFIPDSAMYEPVINVIQGCGNLGSLQYNLNSYGGTHSSITYGGTWPNARYGLYTDDGNGQPGTLITGFGSPNFLSQNYKSDFFANIPSGDYIVRFWQFTRSGWNGNYPSNSLPESSQFHEYSFPFTIEEYEDITMSFVGSLCTDTTGSVLININDGTPIYPLIYNLYDEVNNLIRTDTIYEINSFHDIYHHSVLFTDLNNGNYILQVVSGYTPSNSLGCYSTQMNIVLDNSIANIEIVASDTVFCVDNNVIQLGVPLDLNYWNIIWKTSAGDTVGMNVNPIEVYPESNENFIVTYSSHYDFGCLNVPIYNDTISLIGILLPDTSQLILLGDSICYSSDGTITIVNPEIGMFYGVMLDGMKIDSFLMTSNDPYIFNISDSLLNIGDNYFDITILNAGCEDIQLNDIISIYVHSDTFNAFLDSNTYVVVECISEIPEIPGWTLANPNVVYIDTVISYTDSLCLSNFTKIIQIIATSNCGIKDTLIHNVIVLDSTPPIIPIIEDLVFYTDVCNFSIPNFSSIYSITDNCGFNDSIWMFQNPLQDTVLSVGIFEIELIAFDYCVGNSSSLNFFIEIIDTIPPVIICPNDTVVELSSNCEYLISDYTSSVIIQDCLIDSTTLSIYQSPDVGTVVNMDTTVIISVVNMGEITNCNFNINFLPVYSFNYNCTNDTVFYDANCSLLVPDYSNTEYSFINYCFQEELTLEVTQVPAYSTIFSDSIEVWVYFFNDSLSFSDSCSFKVYGVDTISPVINCPYNLLLDVSSNCTIEIPNFMDHVTVTDNCSILDIDLTIEQFPLPGEVVDEPTLIELTVSDAFGNSYTCAFQLELNYPILINCNEDVKLETNSSCQFILPDFTSDLVIAPHCSNIDSSNISIIQTPLPGSEINIQTVVWIYIYGSNELLDSCSFMVTPGDLPHADFFPSPGILELGNSSQMINTSSGAEFYIWNFGNGNLSNESNPTQIFSEDGEFQIMLIAMDENGCSDTSYAIITIIDELKLFVPNTFTPDGNEFNNVFKPIVNRSDLIKRYKLSVFNRWGEIVFESYNIDIGWDGTYNYQNAPDNTYTWIIELESAFEKKIWRGHTNLIR